MGAFEIDNACRVSTERLYPARKRGEM